MNKQADFDTIKHKIEKLKETAEREGSIVKRVTRADISDGGWISAKTPPPSAGVYLVCVSNYICFQHKKERIKVLTYHPQVGWGFGDSLYAVSHWQHLPDLPN